MRHLDTSHTHYVHHIAGVQQVVNVGCIRIRISKQLAQLQHGVIIREKFNHVVARQMTA